MSRLLASTTQTSLGNNSRLAFTRPPGGTGQRGWERFLTLDGKPAQFIGGACDTCPFLFERKSGANDKISLELSDGLRAGITDLASPVLEAGARAVPKGEYRVLLL